MAYEPGSNNTAGSVKLEVRPSLKLFKQELQTGLKSVNADVRVRAIPSLQGFKTSLTADLRSMTAPSLKVKVAPDIRGLSTQLRADLAGMPKQTLKIGIKPDMTGFRSALRSEVEGVNAPTIRVRTELDFTVARAQLAAFRAEVGIPIATQVHIDTAGALAQVAALRAAVRDIADDGISGQLSGGGGGGRGAGGLRAALGAPVRQVRLQIEVDRSSVAAAEAEIANLGDRIQRARVRAMDASASETAARQRLNEVRSGGGSGTSAETRAQQALTRASRTASEASAEASRLLGRQADAHHRLRAAQNDQNSISRLVSAGFRGIGEAAIGVVSSVAGMINPAAIAKTALIALAGVSLIPLIASASQALGVIALLPGVLAAAAAGGAALLIGSNGITDAFSAMSAESSSAGGAVEDMARKQQDALDSVSDAQQRVIDSQRSETQAIMRAKDAQQSLNDARKDAKNAIDDMNLSLKQGELSEEAAVLSVFRARQRLQEARSDPKSTQLDIAEASLGVRQAEQSVTEVRVRNSQRRDEAKDVNGKGIEGSDQVVGATKDLAEAQYGVTTAQRDSERAARDLIKAQQDAAKSMESAASGGVNKLEEALAKLSPEARKFVEAMRDLGPAWSDLRKAVQDKLFEGLGDSVTELANAQLPTLQTGLEGIAGVINDNLRGALEGLSTEAVSTDLATIFENSRVAIDYLMEGLGNLGGAFLDIATVGTDFLPGLAGPDGFLGWTERFAAKIKEMRDSGALKDFIQGAIDKFGELWHIGGQVVDVIRNIFGSSKETGDDMLVSISQTLDKWNAFLGSEEGQAKMKSFFQDVKDTCSAIADIISGAASVAKLFQGATEPADGTTVDPQGNDGGETGYGSRPKPGDKDYVEPSRGKAPERLGPSGNDDAGFFGKIWGAADDDSGLLGGIARSFNSMFGYNNETDKYDENVSDEQIRDLGLSPDKLRDLGLPEDRIKSLELDVQNPSGIGAGQGARGARNYQGLADQLEGELGITDDALDETQTKVEETQGTFANLRTSIGESLEGVQPKFDAFKLRVGEIATNAFDQITNGAGFTWQGLGNTIGNVVDGITGGAFTRLKDGASGVSSFFQSLSAPIAAVWDGVLSVIKRAVGAIGRLMQKIPTISLPGGISTKGIKELGDALVSFASASSVSNVTMTGNSNGTQIGASGPVSTRATGGPIVGAGTATSDSIPALLSNGEHVLTADEVNKAGGQGAVYRLREAIRNGTVGRFASGGAAVANARSYIDSVVGTPYQLGGLDCSMFASGVYRALLGENPDDRAFDTTAFGTESSAAAMGFQPGLFGSFQVGVNPLPGASGHMAFTLDGIPGESGGSHGDVAFGSASGAIGADDSSFPLQYSLPGSLFAPPQTDADSATPATDYGYGVTPLEGGNYSPTGTYVGPTTDLSGTGADAAMPTVPTLSEVGAKVGAAIFGGLPELLGLEGTFFDDPASSTVGRAVNILSAPRVAGQDPFAQRPTGDVGGLSGGAATPTPSTLATPGGQPNPPALNEHVWDPAKGAEQWQPEVLSALDMTGQSVGNLAATLNQIQIESGGNPKAIGQDSADGNPQGLLQVKPGTFAAYKDATLGDVFEPLSNTVAAINYTVARYPAGLGGTWPTKAGYATGGPVVGPGTGTSDSIPTRLSNGEFVMRASAVNAETLPILQAMNAGQTWAANAAANAQQFRRQPAMAGGGSSSRSEDWSMNFGDVHTTDPRAFRAEVDTLMHRRFRSYTGGLR